MGKLKDLIKGWFSIQENPPTELVPEKAIYDVAKNEEIRRAIVAEVNEEMEKRIEANQPWNMQWLLNLNFIRGNQYCDIFPQINDVIQTVKMFDYQERKAYNVIGSIVETRIAQLNTVDYGLKARPVTNDRDDMIRASLNTKVLKAHCRNQDLPALMRKANAWSESCGTAVMMPVWDKRLGHYLGEMMLDGMKKPIDLREGDINTMVGSPFEILPDSPWNEDVSDCKSIIRYKVYPVDVVEEIWGVDVPGGNVGVLTSQFKDALVPSPLYDGTNTAFSRVEADDSVVVAELWERPSTDYPKGRLAIVAGNHLLYYGALPFVNGRYGQRCLPFITVKSVDVPGCFWGKSIVERLIPVQQQYNACRNRKAEYLSFTSMPVLAVQKNSVDLDILQTEGIAPGTILEYRAGANPPKFLEMPEVPQSLIQEEQNLLSMFTLISGVSEMSWRSQIPPNATSGPMLQIVRELDNTKLSIPAKNGRKAVMQWGVMVMCLSKEYVSVPRIEAIAGDTDAYETFYWDGKEIEYYDLEFETEDELAMSPAQRYLTALEFAKMGLFFNPKKNAYDDLSRSQLLSTLKIGDWENIAQRADQQKSKARAVVEMVKRGQLDAIPKISQIDDNEIAIDMYAEFMLSTEYRKLIAEVPEIEMFMEDLVAQHNAEIQRKAQEEMLNQVNTQIVGEQAQAFAQMNFQNVAAEQTASMQKKYAAQSAANSQTVPTPNAPQGAQGSQQQPSAAQRMAEMMASVQ